MSRKVSRRAVLAGTAAAAAISRFPSPAVAQAEPIKLGLLTVKTGPLAQGGIQMEQGVLRVPQGSQQHDGRPARSNFISADTGGNPAGTKTKAQELIERDKVDMIFGPLAAFELLAITDYVAAHKTPIAQPRGRRGHDPAQAQSVSCCARPATSSQPMYPLADYAAKELKLQDAITIAEDFAFGYEQMGGFQRVFEDDGGRVVKQAVAAAGDARLHAVPCATHRRATASCQGFAGSNPLGS